MNTKDALQEHVAALLACRRCPAMQLTPVSGGPVVSRVMLVGQAPGVKEPLFGRPFAWTAGKTMFKWFESATGLDEAGFRTSIYMAAVCRCFPGKDANGDRVPNRSEIDNCRHWLEAEIRLLRPRLVIPVGKLAISQFISPVPPLHDLIGQIVSVNQYGLTFDVVPLPHPSGASPWHRIEPGKSLVKKGLQHIAGHPAWPKEPTVKTTLF